MRAVARLAFGLGLAVVATAASARSATCLLDLGGRIVIEGRCEFTEIDGDGSFQIMSRDGAYFAQVLIWAPGQAEGWWNESPHSGHAHSPLGDLTRTGACWSNPVNTVCAW